MTYLPKTYVNRYLLVLIVTTISIAGLSASAQAEPGSVTADGGLIYLHGRYYDPALGRFVSADPAEPTGNISANRYAYVGNNPVNAIDPSGYGPDHVPQDEFTQAEWRTRYTALEAENARLRTSSVSGLPGPWPYKDALEALGGQSVQHGFTDVYYFKDRVNDTYGHDAGDQALLEIGRRLKDTIGKRGTVFHKSGDEFLVIFNKGVTASSAQLLLARARTSVRKPIMITTNKGVETPVMLDINVGHGDTPQKAEAMMRAEKTAKHEATGDRRGGGDRRTMARRKGESGQVELGFSGSMGTVAGGGMIIGDIDELLYDFSPGNKGYITSPYQQQFYNLMGPSTAAVGPGPDLPAGPSYHSQGWTLSTGNYGKPGYICWFGPGC